MRSLLIFFSLAVLVALGWLYVQTGAATGLETVAPVALEPEADTGQEAARVSPPTLAPESLVEAAHARQLTPSVAEISAHRPEILWGEQRILGALVSKVTRKPVADYSILVIPAGQSAEDAGAIPLLQRARSDDEGHFELSGLQEPGPWDVYAFAEDLGLERAYAWRGARLGSVTASNPDDAKRVTLQVVTGPRVVLESPLPEGVDVGSVWFELIHGPDDASASRKQQPGEERMRDRRFSRGRAAEDGTTVCDLPWPPGIQFGQTYMVRAVTADGLYSLLESRDPGAHLMDEWRIRRPLEARGKVAVELTIEDPRGEAVTDADWISALESVRWRLLGEDPGRSQDDKALFGAWTIPWNRRWRRIGTRSFELHDLPLSSPVEIGPIPLTRDGRLEAGTFRTETIERTTPVHGQPEPVRVRVRRVR